MKLTQTALLVLRGADKSVKERIAADIGVTMPSLYRFIQENDDNLTKAAALKIIREITGLGDSQLLEEAANAA